MTASTHAVSIETDEGRKEIKGVIFADRGEHPQTGIPGVVVQYKNQPDREKPRTEFFARAEIVAVYDEVADDVVSDTFVEFVNQSRKPAV